MMLLLDYSIVLLDVAMYFWVIVPLDVLVMCYTCLC